MIRVYMSLIVMKQYQITFQIISIQNSRASVRAMVFNATFNNISVVLNIYFTTGTMYIYIVLKVFLHGQICPSN